MSLVSVPVYTWGAQIVISTNGFAHLQSQIWGALWPSNLARCKSAWFGSSNEFWWSYSLVCPCPDKELNDSPTFYGEYLPGPSDQKVWLQSLEVVSLSGAGAERWAGKSNCPQSKASTRHGAFHVTLMERWAGKSNHPPEQSFEFITIIML